MKLPQALIGLTIHMYTIVLLLIIGIRLYHHPGLHCADSMDDYFTAHEVAQYTSLKLISLCHNWTIVD